MALPLSGQQGDDDAGAAAAPGLSPHSRGPSPFAAVDETERKSTV